MLVASQAANALVPTALVGLRQKIVALVRPCAYTVEDANGRHEARRAAAGVPGDEEHLACPHVHPSKRNGQRNEQTTTDA